MDRASPKFPYSVAEWLALEAEKTCDGLPSQLLKRPDEAVKSAGFHHENAFNLIRKQWERAKGNPAFILRALTYARDENVSPPDWVLDSLIEAGSKVYESDGAVEFGEALGFTPKKINAARTTERKLALAELVAEGIDAELSPHDARELAIAEAEIVYGWIQFAPSTVQKYYEKFADEREGFSETFRLSLKWYDYNQDPVYKSFMLPFWRRKVLKTRLCAYREAQEADNNRQQTLQLVVDKTVGALNRTPPPKDRFGHFIESDF